MKNQFISVPNTVFVVPTITYRWLFAASMSFDQKQVAKCEIMRMKGQSSIKLQQTSLNLFHSGYNFSARLFTTRCSVVSLHKQANGVKMCGNPQVASGEKNGHSYAPSGRRKMRLKKSKAHTQISLSRLEFIFFAQHRPKARLSLVHAGGSESEWDIKRGRNLRIYIRSRGKSTHILASLGKRHMERDADKER